MINTIQPFVNLANANLQAISRFFQAPELGDLSKSNTNQFGKVAQDSFMQLTQSDALRQLSRDLTQNYSRFTNECTQSYFALMTQTPNLLAHQVQDFSRQIEKGVGAGFRAVERPMGKFEEEAEEGVQGEDILGKGKARTHRAA